MTLPSDGRPIVTWGAVVDVWAHVAAGSPPQSERGSARVATLTLPRATDVRLVRRAPPRGECVCQPTDAASLHLLDPWGTILRARALTGRRCETWAEVGPAGAEATADGHTQRPPFVWGRCRRHRARRQAGMAVRPKAA